MHQTKRTYLLVVVLIAISNLVIAQNYFQVNPFRSFENGVELQYPWVGGINNAQLSTPDLDNNGIPDLVIFDQQGNRLLTFINLNISGVVKYRYEPLYQSNFPEIKDWMLMVDYNCDGIKDIWSSNDNGIQVHEGNYNNPDELGFTLASNQLFYDVSGNDLNIFVSTVDVPAFLDVNGDSDIDILTFNPSGGYVEYFENQSVENGNNCDELYYNLVNSCWGDFYESGLTPEVDFNNTDNPDCIGGRTNAITNRNAILNGDVENGLHAGSTVLSFDIEGDNDLDLLLGDLAFDNFNMLYNGANNTEANMFEQDINFPSNSIPVDLPNFPAPYLEDLNNDGKKDLIAVPNSKNGSMNVENVWFYPNVGTATNHVFEFDRNDLFVENMIDVGEGCFPVIYDWDQDGKEDLIIGNYGYFQPQSVDPISGLAYFRNVGVPWSPTYELVTRDLLDLGQLGLLAMHPSFGDLDGDGDADLIIGEESGKLHYFRNDAGVGNPTDLVLAEPEYQGIDVGKWAAPQIIDMNGDNLLDMVIGDRNGVLKYYQNIGTANNANFILANDFFGEVRVREPGQVTGYSNPFITDLESDGTKDLLVASERGWIYRYEVDPNKLLIGAFNLVEEKWSDIDVGNQASIVVSDIDDLGDPELLIGNYAGGISIFATSDVSGIGDATNLSPIKIYPNPTQDQIFIDLKDVFADVITQHNNSFIKIYDVLGRMYYNQQIDTHNQINEIDVQDLASGIYLVHIQIGNQLFVNKVLVD